MKKLVSHLVTGALLFAALLGCSPKVEQSSEQAESAYQALAKHYFEQDLILHPINGTYIGRNEFNGQFVSTLSDEYLEKRHNLNTETLANIAKIDASKLTEASRLSLKMLEYNAQQALVGETFPERMLPLNQFYSLIFTMSALAQEGSAQPFNNNQDYQNWYLRLQGFSRWLAQAKEKFELGVNNKVTLPRTLTLRVIEQLEALQPDNVQDSLFYAPITFAPQEIDKPLLQKLQQLVQNELSNNLAQLSDYLSGSYLKQSRTSDGMWDLPNGPRWYQYLADSHTTTDMPVAEIHQLGLQEVERIRAEMDKVRQHVGFNGDLAAFLTHMGSDEQFFFATKADLIQAYQDKRKAVDAVLPRYFDVAPKADYVIKPVEAYREKSAAGASYESPSVDGTRPGVFYINTYNLKAQPTWGVTTLSLHEAAPGHHFQIAIKQELENVADFQKFGGYTAFEEGWALYVEHLGIEMGLFDDPYQYFGKLSDEMLRAMRLVVDTGLHSQGWTREHAIDYMLNNSAMAKTDVAAEVERYMAIPGQALSYKVGQLAILQLQQKAQRELGEKYSHPAFHSQVLTSGSMPMALLEQKIESWIKAEQQ